MTLSCSQTSGIVLAGTYSSWTRAAFDRVIPRPLLPVAHRPLISYSTSWLYDAGVRELAICGNRDSRALQTAVARHVPVDMAVTYVEDPMPRGTAGCVRDAAAELSHDTFVVVEGTAIPNTQLAELVAAHGDSGAAVTVVVHTDRRSKGSAGLQTSTGMYVFSRRALELVPESGFCDIKEGLIPKLHQAGERVVPHEVPHASARILDSDTYLAVNSWVVERVVSQCEPVRGFQVRGDALVHCHARVADDVQFIGPVLVAEGARIDSGALVVGPCSIGCDAVIESDVIVSRSAVWRRSVLQPGAVADRAIVCDDAVLTSDNRLYHDVLVSPDAAAFAGGAAQRRVQEWRGSAADMWRRLERTLSEPDGSRASVAR